MQNPVFLKKKERWRNVLCFIRLLYILFSHGGWEWQQWGPSHPDIFPPILLHISSNMEARTNKEWKILKICCISLGAFDFLEARVSYFSRCILQCMTIWLVKLNQLDWKYVPGLQLIKLWQKTNQIVFTV